MNIAALISYFNDVDMLELQLKSGQFDVYERIYIFDGPFSFTKSIEFMSIKAPKLTDTSIGQRILNYPCVVNTEIGRTKKKSAKKAYNAVKG